MNKSYWFLIILLVMFVTLVLYSLSTVGKTKERAKKNFDEFNQANLIGHVEGVWIERKLVGLKLINHKSYVFDPYTDKELNEGRIFENFAEYGDKIIKEPYSDTLYLIKEGKVYKYKFGKF